jgi:hypothetical protein
MYISGYGFLWQNVQLPGFAKTRLAVSSRFAGKPTEQDAQLLRNDRIDYFILDKSRISPSNWNNTAELIHTSNRFDLYRLMK